MSKTALPQRDELPKHNVLINDFWIDEHEVTNAPEWADSNEVNKKVILTYAEEVAVSLEKVK